MKHKPPELHPTVRMRKNHFAVARWRVLDHFGMNVIRAETDRVWCSVPIAGEEGLLKRFDQLEQAGELVGRQAFHAVPKDLLAELGCDKAAKIRSYSGRLPNTLAGDQWIVYRLFRNGVIGGLIVEQDVDRQSPIDAAGLFPHLWMVLKHKITKSKTDPFETAMLLRKAGIPA